MLNSIIELGISKVEAEELIKVSNNIERDLELLKKGYPIQYLIGYVNFYGNKMHINENVLIPRYETELLVEKTIDIIQNHFDKPSIIDIGTGSGCIAISIKKELECNMDACDVSVLALEVAKKNALLNNITINFYESDILTNINNKYDVIISNPPYIAYNEEVMEQVKKYEPNNALYADDEGLYFYKEIINQSKNKLKNNFLIAFEIGYKQADRIIAYAKEIYPTSKIIIEKDYSEKDRFIFIINE